MRCSFLNAYKRLMFFYVLISNKVSQKTLVGFDKETYFSVTVKISKAYSSV